MSSSGRGGGPAPMRGGRGRSSSPTGHPPEIHGLAHHDFEPRMKRRAAGPSVKVELAGGDFSPLAGHANPGKGRGDIVTEFVHHSTVPAGLPHGKAWSEAQRANIDELTRRGAWVQTGVDLKKPAHVLELTRDLPIGKIKAENLHGARVGGGGGEREGELLPHLFRTANEVLAGRGVLEYGHTGPLHKGREFDMIAPVIDVAREHGFEPVEMRCGHTSAHSFSQGGVGSDPGMRDLRRTQIVFARSGEAAGVRDYYQRKMKEESPDERTGADGKLRVIAGGRVDHRGALRRIGEYHESLGRK